MSDDLERRLAAGLRDERLPDAPDTLHAFLERLPAAAEERRSQPRRRLAWLAPTLVTVVAAALTFALLPRGTHPIQGSPSPLASSPPGSAAPTAIPSASSQPFGGVTVYTAPVIAPVPNIAGRAPNGAWSPDASLLAAEEEGTNEGTIHVFDTTGHEVWDHAGQFAAWVGPDRLAMLVRDPNDRTQNHLSIVTLSSGQVDALPGSYLAFMLAAPNGTLAVATWTDSTTPPRFALVTQARVTATYDGDPLAWSPDSRLLAFGLPTDRLHQEMLSILDVTTGQVRHTDLRVSDTGVTWDETGRQLVVGVIPGAGTTDRPTLVNVTSGTTVESPIQGYFSGAAQVADGRWVLWTDPEAFLWDPAHPGAVTALGYGISVTPNGVLVDFEPPASTPADSSPVPLPSLTGITVERFDTPLPDFLEWTSSGDRVAYTVPNGKQVDLKIR